MHISYKPNLMQCDEFPLSFSCGTISMHILRTTSHFQQNYTSCNVTSFLALPSPSLSLTSSSPTSFCPSPLSLSLLYPAPSPLPPSSSPLLFLQILCYLFRTCKWRSTTPETLRRLTCTSEGRRWQRWWALLPLNSRRTDTGSLVCSSNVDSTTISLTPLTSLVSVWCHVMACDLMLSCDLMWWHVISCNVMWHHVMACDFMWCRDLVMACDLMWCHVILWCHVISWWHVISCDLVMSCDFVMACDLMWCHNLNMKVAKPYTIHWIFLVKKRYQLYVNLKVQYQRCIDVQLL